MRTPKDKVKLAQALTEAALRKRRRAQALLEEAEQDLAKAGLMLQEVAANVLDEYAVLGDAITTFGEKAQEAMLLEEMSEMQKEICKHWRGRDNVAEIAEEIADVEIMLDQVKMIFCCAGRVRAIRASKIRRLEERIREARG